MPPNHDHDHDHERKHGHEHDRRRDQGHDRNPKPKGPKERELAVALTVAVLGAAGISEPVSAVEKLTLDIYDRMLAAITRTAPADGTVSRE